MAPQQGIVGILSYTMIPLGLMFLLLSNLAIGVDKIRLYNFAETLNKTAHLGIVVLLFLGGIISVKNIFFSNITAAVLSIGLLLFSLNKISERPVRANRDLFVSSFSYGFRAYVASLFSFLLIRADMLMVQSYLGNEATGYYSTAVTFVDLLYMLPVIIGNILFPKMSAMQSEGEKKKMAIQFAWITAGIMFFAVGAAFVMSDFCITLMYGNKFLPAGQAFRWLLPGIFALSVNTIFMNYLTARGAPMIIIWSPFAGLALNIILNTFLIPGFGIIGASIASSLSYLLILLISITYVRFTAVPASSHT